VEHEREPLRRGQRLEDHQQGQPDRVGHDHVALRVRVGPGANDRLRKPRTGELLPARLPLPQGIQADPADHDRQPAPKVIGPAGVASIEPQPGLLHGVLGVRY
jgi:hypothetical protein